MPWSPLRDRGARRPGGRFAQRRLGADVPQSSCLATSIRTSRAGGRASGFLTQGDSEQTHNVVATSAGDATYSPLWSFQPYSNQHSDAVFDLTTGTAVDSFGHVSNVNCPIVFTQ